MADSDEEVLRRLVGSDSEALRKLLEPSARRPSSDAGAHILICQASAEAAAEIFDVLKRAGVAVQVSTRKVHGVRALYMELDKEPPEAALIAARDLAGEGGIAYVRMPPAK